MRTRDSIEAQQSSSVVTPRKTTEKRAGLKNLVAPWKPGQSGNPKGRPKTDMSQIIARQVFENNPELLYKAYSKALAKGQAFAFQVLSDRAYGKMKESLHVDGSLSLSDTIRKARERAALPAKETSGTE